MLSIYLHSHFYGGLRKTFLFQKVGRFSRSRSSKVTDFGANRKHVCNFLLVRNGKLGPILHRFGDSAVFMWSWPRPYSTLILGVFPLTRSPILGSASAQALSYLAVKLFSKYSNLCDHGTFKACPHCRRKVRLSQKIETVAEKCDSRRISPLSRRPLSRRFRRQSHFSATVALFCDSVDRA